MAEAKTHTRDVGGMAGTSQFADAVLVAMTGYAQPEDKRRATEAGFHEHMAKPPSIERLEEVLSRVAPSLS